MFFIRQISDPVLHKKPFLVDFENDEHIKQLSLVIQIMKNDLYAAGGIGIAANQCQEIANPPQVFIIGNNDLAKAQLRYPDKKIPQELVMINPAITDFSSPYYPETGEGCLSVNSCMRAKVLRYKTIKVEYFDIVGIKHSEIFEDFSAHIIQHEYDHLQGIVYLQKIIEELNKEQIEALIKMINDRPASTIRDIKSPLIVIDRDENNQIVLLADNLQVAIGETHVAVLNGVKAQLCRRLSALSELK